MRCAIFLAKGFEDCEGLITIDMLRRAGIPVDSVSITDDLIVETSHGVCLFADKIWKEIDPSGYERIYVGYPIWWGEEPRILDTFVESYDFGTITMIPFCTSASSGIGRSGKNLAENAKCGNWLDGKRFSGSVSESDLESWMKGLN